MNEDWLIQIKRSNQRCIVYKKHTSKRHRLEVMGSLYTKKMETLAKQRTILTYHNVELKLGRGNKGHCYVLLNGTIHQENLHQMLRTNL